MIKLEIKIEDQEVSQALKRLADLGKDLKPAMRDIGELLVASTKARFAAGEGPDGEAWEANRESTKASYARRRGGSTVRRRGEKSRAGNAGGKRPLIGESKRLGSEIHYRADGNGVEIGSALEYAAVQQFGAKKGSFGSSKRGPIPWGDIPARPFLGVSDDDKVNVLDIIQEHLESATRD